MESDPGMGNGRSTLRVKVPCADEGDFYARLADRIAENGLRLPAEERPAIGAHARVALEFRDGGVLSGDAVVEEHVDLDSRPGVKVRIVKLDPPKAPLPAPRPAPRAPPAPQPPPAPARAPRAPEAELAQELFGDASAPAPGDGRTGALSFTVSTEIAAAVERRTARFQRAAILVAALAALVALGGFGAARWWRGPATPEAAAAAHVQAADRLLAEGRLTGKDGALEHLLAARRLRPADAGTARRLDRLADMLERLAAGALDRGDLEVASIHLASARAAAPHRPSLAAKQAELDRRMRGRPARR
ncbi:MAG TPA: hypothetical protein VFL83_03995 [Anaeromyxobacter sp.]|nr:hypothetical protein [Anaeromyxobacter sp.]